MNLQAQKGQNAFSNRNTLYILLTLLLLVYLFNGIQYLQAQSINSDEASFYDYAKRFIRGNPVRLEPITDNSKMPISVLNTIPRIIEQFQQPGLQKSDFGLSDIMHGRYITLFASCFTILLVFKWSNELYGRGAGFFAAFMMAFCPNNLSNATFVTTDSYSVLAVLTCMYTCYRFLNSGKLNWFILFSASIAISQLVKQSLFHLYVLVPLLFMVAYFVLKPTIYPSRLLGYISVFIFINWFIINAGYYFYETNTPIGKYEFSSGMFTSIQHWMPAWLPIPLPSPFVTGLDMAKYYDQIGGGYDGVSSFGKVTILGKESTGGAFWYYYLVSILFKTPIAYFVILIVSALAYFRRFNIRHFISNEFILLLAPIYYLVVFSLAYNTQCGLRHLIFIYPFLFIFSSSIVAHIRNRFQFSMLILVSLYLIISVSAYARNYYTYTNEFIWKKKDAYQTVGASNLDFRQGFYFYEKYLSKHPRVQIPGKHPQTGLFLVRISDYMDIWNRGTYSWLKHIKPRDHVAHSALIIEVKAEDLKPLSHNE